MNLFDRIKDFPFVLAPLAGYTDYPFRKICVDYGASLVFTEMINVYSLSARSVKIKELLYYSDNERPIGIQLFGNNPEKFFDSAKIAAEIGFDLIDINFGCPVPKVTNASSGCTLMTKPQLAGKIIESAVKGAGKVPVSIKIRSGWDEKNLNYLEFNRMAQDCGVSIIIMHPRTRGQMFRGRSAWEQIKILKENSKLFVIGNGDVIDRASAYKMLSETGCDAVMIGRAAIGNPFIFSMIKNPEYNPTMREQFEAALKHYDMLVSFKGKRGIYEMRKYFAKYIRAFDEAAHIRKEIITLEDPAQVKQILLNFLEKHMVE